MSTFQLQPFPTDVSLPAIEIVGTMERQDNLLSIEYRLSGELKSIEIPPAAVAPTRKDRLWEATCFEFFLGIPGERDYWEFNLAPTGDWNIFHLDDYRQGLRDELAFSRLPLRIDLQPDLFSLALTVDLSKIISSSQQLEVSITTVIKPIRGEISYWALTHCGTSADFHERDSFSLKT